MPKRYAQTALLGAVLLTVTGCPLLNAHGHRWYDLPQTEYRLGIEDPRLPHPVFGHASQEDEVASLAFLDVSTGGTCTLWNVWVAEYTGWGKAGPLALRRLTYGRIPEGFATRSLNLRPDLERSGTAAPLREGMVIWTLQFRRPYEDAHPSPKKTLELHPEAQQFRVRLDPATQSLFLVEEPVGSGLTLGPDDVKPASNSTGAR